MDKQQTMKTSQAISPLNIGEGEKLDPVDPLPVSAQIPEQPLGKAQGAAEYAGSPNSSAPLYMTMEFVTALMSCDYESALLLCKRIMEHEPNNRMAAEFYPLLLKKNIQAVEKSSGSEDDSDSDGCSDETSTCSCRTGSTCSRCNSDEDSSSDESSSDSDKDQDENDNEKEKGARVIRMRL